VRVALSLWEDCRVITRHVRVPAGNDPLGAKRILVAWLNAGWKTGAILGGTYGAAYAALATGFFWFVLLGLACGCVVGFFAGLVAGVVNGVVISALAGPFALRRGGMLARRLRAALVAVTTTEAVLLPVQLTLGHGVPIADIVLLTAPILGAALCLAATIAPAGYRAGSCWASPRVLGGLPWCASAVGLMLAYWGEGAGR
jgi:hypothetical protein